jgi:hypothetical protein
MYNVNEQLENNYLLINIKNKYIFLICNTSLNVSKKCNAAPHIMIMPKGYMNEYPDSSEEHRIIVEDLKLNLISR